MRIDSPLENLVGFCLFWHNTISLPVCFSAFMHAKVSSRFFSQRQGGVGTRFIASAGWGGATRSGTTDCLTCKGYNVRNPYSKRVRRDPIYRIQ